MTSREASERLELPVADRVVVAALLEETCEAWGDVYRSAFRATSMATGSTELPVNFTVPEVMVRRSSRPILDPDSMAELQKLEERGNAEKFRRDSLQVLGLLEKLRAEVREEGSFESLSRQVENLENREHEEKTLTTRYEEAIEEAVALKDLLAESKRFHEREERRLTEKLASTMDEVEETRLIAAAEGKYLRAWEKTRCEQNSLQQREDVERLREDLRDLSVREHLRKRLHREKTLFLDQYITSMGVEVEGWQRRYHSEREMYEKEIRKIRNEIETRRVELDELAKEHREKQDFIDMYEAEKEAARRQEEHEEFLRQTAIRIQAWWRGVMVRKKLGPYRVEEKRKKKSSKQKK